jgi:hypothetical protein
MYRTSYPPFSPDLAPSDFRLFGKLKTTPMGPVFSDENELFHGVRHVLSRILPDELEVVFANWLARLDIGC